MNKDLLKAEEDLHNELAKLIPDDRIINTAQFKRIYDQVRAGQRDAYLVDLRSHPEFYAGHIEGTDHIHAGHFYTFPKKVTDANAEIVIFCRTSRRARYNAGSLIRFGYKNVWVWSEGIVGWIEAGYPLVNQFMGEFKVTRYQQEHKELCDTGKPLWKVREFHLY